jgi:hypothetical protein
MSYHRGPGLGFELPGLNLPGLPGGTATVDPAVADEIAAKEAARDQARAITAEADRRKREAEQQAINDRNLKVTEYSEDWTPVPEDEPTDDLTSLPPVPEQKTPWLWIGAGVLAVGAIGFYIWRK